MDGHPGPTRDRATLIEVVLVLALIALGLLLYWRPALEGALAPRWWHWVVLGSLFFATVGFHSWRRNRRNRLALRQVIRDEAVSRKGSDEGGG